MLGDNCKFALQSLNGKSASHDALGKERHMMKAPLDLNCPGHCQLQSVKWFDKALHSNAFLAAVPRWVAFHIVPFVSIPHDDTGM